MFFGKKKQIDTDKNRIEEVLSRGVEEVIDKDTLTQKMSSGKELRVKLGIDPTSPNLHLGRSIPLLKLRDFQNLGHKVVLIIGDATGVVGDTSDKDSERPMLTRRAVLENKKTYLEQAGKVLNMKDVEVRHNSEWLDKLHFDEIGEQADQFSVSDFIARDNIKKRLGTGKRVSLREMIYPLMQGYDSVAIKSDVEVGGTDQRFNLLSGRTLQKHYKQEPQDIVVGPLIEGTDGRKMSSSFGNTINLTDDANDMYGKLMRVHDELIEKYLILTTRVPMGEIEKIVSNKNPRDSKMRLAFEIVKMYHSEEKARDAKSFFVNTFSEREVPDTMPAFVLVGDIRNTVVANKLVRSGSEWDRLVASGAVKDLNSGNIITNPKEVPKGDTKIKIGKKIFVEIKTK